MSDTISRIEMIAKGLPDASDVYIDPELTSVAEEYVASQDLFVARKMIGAAQTAKQTGQFPSFSKADYNRDEMTERADGAESAVTGFRQTWKSFSCVVESLAHDVGPQRRANDPKAGMRAARFLMNKALLAQEVDFATTCWNNGIWTTEYTGHSATDTGTNLLTWRDADADPFEQLERVIEAYELVGVNFPINRLMFSADTWKVFKNHPKVLARFNQGQTSGGVKVTQEMVSGVLGIERVIIGKAVKTTSAPGIAEASSTYGRIFSTGVLGLHAVEGASVNEPCAATHIDWTGYTGAGGMGQAIFEEPVPNTRGAIRHEMEQATTIKLVSADLGFWLEDILTAAA